MKEKIIRAFEIIKLKIAYEKDMQGAYETAQESIRELKLQPKTFTLDEIKEIINNFVDYKFERSCMFDVVAKNKCCSDVGDCRECLLQEFEQKEEE